MDKNKPCAKRAKSGCAGGSAPGAPRTGGLDLAPHLAFLPDISAKRTTISSPFSADKDAPMQSLMKPLPLDVDSDAYTSSASQQLRYSYSAPKRKYGGDNQLFKDMLVSQAKLVTKLLNESPMEPHLLFWQSMLCKMDEDKKDDVVAKVTLLILQETKDYKELNKNK